MIVRWIWSKMETLNDELFPGPIPPWIRIAQREIGVHEWIGRENPRIIEYHKATTLRATEDEVAWCSSFMNWVMAQCNMERSHSAAARSWLGYGRRLTGFKKYSIVVLKRGNSSWQGHVAFAMELKNGYVYCLGGNQSNKVGYANYREADVLAYLWPKPETGAEVHPPG